MTCCHQPSCFGPHQSCSKAWGATGLGIPTVNNPWVNVGDAAGSHLPPLVAPGSLLTCTGAGQGSPSIDGQPGAALGMGARSSQGHGDYGETTSSQELCRSNVSQDITSIHSLFSHPTGNTCPFQGQQPPASPRHGWSSTSSSTCPSRGDGCSRHKTRGQVRGDKALLSYSSGAGSGPGAHRHAAAHADRTPGPARPPASARSAPAAPGHEHKLGADNAAPPHPGCREGGMGCQRSHSTPIPQQVTPDKSIWDTIRKGSWISASLRWQMWHQAVSEGVIGGTPTNPQCLHRSPPLSSPG